MTKNLIKSIAITMVFIPVVTFASPAPSTAPVSSPASSPQASAPATGSSASTASSNPSSGDSSSTSAPATSNSSATVNNTPTGGSSSATSPSTGGSSSTASEPTSTPTPTPTATPTPAPVNPTNGGSGSSSGGSSSSSGSRVAYPYACNQFTSFMRYGANNDSNQVIKLQTFLRDAEKMNITVNGIFDKQTENAVIAFQNKYNSTIMGPWGSSKGSGYVYITTIKQINKIACSIPLSLNPQELAIINEYKNRRGTASSVIVTPKVENTPVQIEVKNEGNTIILTSSPEANTEATASVAKSSVMNRFWKFLVYLFK